MITTGGTEAIAAAMLGLVEPGDEVVVLEPYYDSYVAMIEMAGGVRRPVTLRAPDFRLDIDALRAAVTTAHRFVLLNSPHNPTGTVLTRAELQAVADVAIEHDLVVMTDEVYEHLRLRRPHARADGTLPGMFERTVTLSSAGKRFSFTGWKVGWATGPADLVGAVLAAKQWLTFTQRCSPAARGRARADHEPDFSGELAGPRRRKRDLLVRRAGRARPRVPCRRAPTSRPPTSAPRLARRHGVLPRAARAGRRRRDPDPGLLRRPGRGPAPGAVGVLQGARRDRGRACAGCGEPTCTA